MSSSKAMTSEPHSFLRKKAVVGSANSERISHALRERVFQGLEADVAARKKEVDDFKAPHFTGAPCPWNGSVRLETTDRRGRLALNLRRVRSGFLGVLGNMKQSETNKIEYMRHVNRLTGKGPCGCLSGEWVNLSEDTQKIWNNSTSLSMPPPPQFKAPSVQPPSDYLNPIESVTELNLLLREKKAQYVDVRRALRSQVLADFPQASESKIVAACHRILDEKLLSYEKTRRWPILQESFKPNLSLTSKDRRFYRNFHPGLWSNDAPALNDEDSDQDIQGTWSCCQAEREDALGCEREMLNPDRWCLASFNHD